MSRNLNRFVITTWPARESGSRQVQRIAQELESEGAEFIRAKRRVVAKRAKVALRNRRVDAWSIFEAVHDMPNFEDINVWEGDDDEVWPEEEPCNHCETWPCSCDMLCRCCGCYPCHCDDED